MRVLNHFPDVGGCAANKVQIVTDSLSGNTPISPMYNNNPKSVNNKPCTIITFLNMSYKA